MHARDTLTCTGPGFVKINCNNRVSIARLSIKGLFSCLHQKVFVEVQRKSKIMASGRQLSDGFYLRRSLALMDPSADDLICFLNNMLLDFERRLCTKLFDVNRTLTALSSEARRSVVVEHVPELIFERAIKESLGGRKEMTVRTVEQLLQVVPAHALVRKHYSGDFCIMLPLLRCVNFIPAEALQNLPLPPFTPNFSAGKQEVFVAIGPAPFSDNFVEVFSPFPGDGPAVNPEDYPTMRLSCGESDFVFPPGNIPLS